VKVKQLGLPLLHFADRRILHLLKRAGASIHNAVENPMFQFSEHWVTLGAVFCNTGPSDTCLPYRLCLCVLTGCNKTVYESSDTSNGPVIHQSYTNVQTQFFT